MGLHFKDLVIKEEIAIKDLKGKILAVDSLNMLYQFLTTIRGIDGSPLTDKKGRVTSHLIGLFTRTTALMEEGLKLVFVFDGEPPEIKKKTWEKRSATKATALLKFQEAQELGDLGEMKKHASRTAVLTRDMRQDAINIIAALGLPMVQAPSEGEAQTAYMVKQGSAYASVSQDYDNLIFGCPLLVRNLSIAGKRKKTGKLAYETIKPQLISLPKVLEHLKLTPDQLIVLAILVGTDYNPGGVHGIGPKNALKLLHQYGTDFEQLFAYVGWEKASPDLSWRTIFDTIKHIPVTDHYSLEWQQLDEARLYALLVDEYDFSAERVKSRLATLKESQKQLQQKGLGSFF